MPAWLVSLLAFLVGMGSWGGLGYLTTYYVPDSSTIALSLFLVFLAVVGTVMPMVHFLNYRLGVVRGPYDSGACPLVSVATGSKWDCRRIAGGRICSDRNVFQNAW